MKKLQFFSFAILLFSTLTLTSCSDVEPIDPNIIVNPDPNNPDNPDNPDPVTPGEFTVDFDDETFTASSTSVVMAGGSIYISALRTTGDSFGFYLNGTATGTYPASDNIIGYNPVGGGNTYTPVNPTVGEPEVGAVIITEIDATNKTISGTFSFVGYRTNSAGTAQTKTFTNGSFTELPYVMQSGTNDTFFTKVNGIDFVDTDLLTSEITVGTQEYIAVAAQNEGGNSITVAVRSNLGPGSYDVTGNAGTDVVQINYSLAEGDVATSATAGIVTITAKTDTQLTATFSGTVIIGETTYQITEGTFNVSY